MRRSGNVSRSTAAVVLLSLLAACATRRPATPRAAPIAQLPVPGPPTVTVTQPSEPAAPTLPPVSVGPRQDQAAPLPAPAAPPQRVVPSTAPPVAPSQRGKFIVLNFDNADIETVVHAASEIVGFNYVLAPDVRGKVTVQTSGRIPQEDVFGVLLAILEVHGFTAVKAGTLYKIVRIEGARERAVPTIVGREPDPNRTSDEVITQIVPVRFANVSDMSTLLRPLMSARGTIIAHRETNVLILNDTASNVRRLLDVLRMVDVEVAVEALEIIPVQFADAADLATILNQLFVSGRVRAPTPAGLPPPPPAAPGAPPQPQAPGGPVGQTGGGERPPLIIPERRSNSLIVHARKVELETIRRLIAQLDVNIYGGRRVFIYYAENAKAKDLAATLNAIYGAKETVSVQPTPGTTGPTGQTGRRPGEAPQPPPPPPTAAPGAPLTPGTAEVGLAEGQIRFIADETTNSVIVTTYPKNWTDIEATIKQLDKMPRQVLIEVLVAEITLNDDTRLGLDWALRQGSFRLAQQALDTTAPASFSLTPAVSAIAPLAGGGLTAFAFESRKFFAILNLLASENRVNIVSNPHVMTSENKKAVINVSTSVPIITGQQTSTVSTPGTTAGSTSTTITTGGVNQTVEYRDAGVVLTVTPRIGERGTVALDLKQEVNAVGAAVAPTNSPSFIKREAETSVVLLNDQTLVVGGLIQDTVTTDDRGIPLLKNIPIIGYLFGLKEKKIQKTELILLITPRVIGTALDAARITDQMRRVTPELDETVRRAPRPPVTAPPPLPSTVPVPSPVPAPTSSVPAPSAPVPPIAPPAPAPDTTPQAVPPAPSAPPAPSGVPPIPLPPSSPVP